MTTPAQREHIHRERAIIRPILLPATDAAGHLIQTQCRLFGLALVNSDAANVAAFELFDGGDAGGVPVLPGNIPAASSVRVWFGPHGIDCQGGLFHTSALTVSGVVWLEHLPRD